MAYFLKKSKLKKGIYLQIYESFYDPDCDLLQKVSHFDFSIYQVLSSLIYANTVKDAYTVLDASQTWSFQDTLSQLFDTPKFSQCKLEMALDFLGEKYQEILEIYKQQLHKVYGGD